MSPGGIAALVASGAFLMLVVVLAVPILRLRHTVDATTRALSDVADATGPMLGSLNTTVENVNTTLGQVQTSLDGVNLQLARLDTITEHVQHVTANVANLTTVVTAAAANPLVKVAAFGYGVRKAAAKRRNDEQEAQVRAEMKERRREASNERPADEAVLDTDHQPRTRPWPPGTFGLHSRTLRRVLSFSEGRGPVHRRPSRRGGLPDRGRAGAAR